jgi:hypothetical protein
MTPDQRARLLLAKAENDAAHEYAALLRVGSEILEMDDLTINWYRHRLPAALARRGLGLEAIPGGWRVVPAPFAPPLTRVVPRTRCRCGQPWFDCPCTAPALEIPW